MTVTPEYLRLLLEYHYWARDRALAALALLSAEQYARPMGNSFASVRDTINHVYMAEWVWHSRWMGQSPTGFPPDQDLGTPAALRTKWKEMEGKVRALVTPMDAAAVERVYEYTVFSGKTFRSKFWEMLVHVVNHATYHRGQVTTLLRQLGARPPESEDMSTFFRLRPS